MSSQSVVVILRRDSEESDALAAELSRASVRALIQQSTDQLHDVINRERVDAVVIDNKLGGFLTGIEIVERLYKDLLRPKTFLVGQVTSAEREQATNVGIDVLIPPTATIEEIAKLVAERVQQAAAFRSPLPIEVRKLAASIDFQGPMPQLLVKLVTYLDVDKSSVKELARDISVDTRTTAELLRLANSSASGLRRKAANVSEAVNHLGIRRTVCLILSAAVVSTQKQLTKGLAPEFCQWHQRRSVLIASVAASFAESLEGISSDTAHVMGLFQDLGILVMARARPDQYLPLLSRVNAIGQLQLPVSEAQAFGYTHAQVTAALLQKWELPRSFVDMVLSHHDTEEGERSQLERKFHRVMQIGEAVANCADSLTVQRKHVLNRLLAHYGEENAKKCKAALEAAVRRSAELSQLFSIPVPDGVEMAMLIPEMMALVNQEEARADDIESQFAEEAVAVTA